MSDCRDYPSDFGPFHFAAYFGLKKAIEDLSGKPTAYPLVDSWGRNPIHIACQRVQADRSSRCHPPPSEESAHLDNHSNLSTNRSDIEQSLETYSGDFFEIVEYLSSTMGYLVNKEDNQGKVPLHYVVM
jgi:hypothetical protein